MVAWGSGTPARSGTRGSPKPSSALCPSGVGAKAGNTLTCKVSYANGDKGRVLVTIVATHGSKATLKLAGASAPTTPRTWSATQSPVRWSSGTATATA